MAVEIHQDKVAFTVELACHSAERVYLTRSASNQIFLPLAIDLLECLFCIALDILATDGLHKLINCGGDVVFCSLLLDVIAASNCFVTLRNKLFAYLKSNASTGTLSAHILIDYSMLPMT